MTIRRWIGAVFAAISLPVCAQSVPAYNVSDMWWNPNEAGWAISMMQGTATNQVYALWHTYDPREPETSTGNPSDYKPIWIVMTGGTWTTPTIFVGDAFVTNGTSYWLPWVNGSFVATKVGRFTINFTSSSTATFTYEISPPSGLASNDPAFGLPSIIGSKSIRRFDF
jgi:hypothetical protein